MTRPHATTSKPLSLRRAAAALALALAAVTALPAIAADPEPGKSDGKQAQPDKAPDKQATDEGSSESKAANPCAVQKKKKRKGPCAVGG
jgi:hypothetical protein